MIYMPMYYLGILGLPRRYYAWDESIQFIPPSAHTMNKWITITALFVAAVQLLFLFNLVCRFSKQAAGGNPWRATTLEWQTPDTPPRHGNWGERLPVRVPLGLRTTACPARKKISSRKTFRPTSWRRSCTRTRPADRAS